MDEFTQYLEPNFFVDADHPAIQVYAARIILPELSPKENIQRLYYAIRDGIRYNPWGVIPKREAFQASAVALRDPKDGGHCIDKANLLAACARHIQIPSRLHFANVRNHIGTEDLARALGTDLMVFHGYVELHLEGRWVAATPAFNRGLCERLGVSPLEFDGSQDSIFQEFDRQGGRFMEYVFDYGTFAEIPFDLMISEWETHYPSFRARTEWPGRREAWQGKNPSGRSTK